MVAEPGATVVTTPELLMVVTEALLLLHVPPPVASAKVLVAPLQIVFAPVIAATEGSALTVTVAVVVQPLTLYVITVVPADTPVTTPEELTVAMPMLPLVHVPPAVGLARVVVEPTHTSGVPVIVFAVTVMVNVCCTGA